MRLVLASASPRRAELLTAAGFTFDILATSIDETRRSDETPRDYVRRLAAEKAAATLARLNDEPSIAGSGRLAARTGQTWRGPGESHVSSQQRRSPDPPDLANPPDDRMELVVVGADTTVVVEDEILGKPMDSRDAERMLRLLSGGRHIVMTGVCVRSAGAMADAVDETQVCVHALTDEQIAWYVASGEGVDKAGAYAIQGLASRFISRIEGSYSNVVGLPVATLDELIRRVRHQSSVLASGGSSELF